MIETSHSLGHNGAMTTHFKDLFQQTLARLGQGEHPQLTLEQSTRQDMLIEWGENPNKQVLLACLCLLDHSVKSYPEFNDHIVKTFFHEDDELVIFALGAFCKHTITSFHLKGERLPHHYVENLGKLLGHPSWEVKEWTLRALDELGSQALFLWPEVIRIKPGLGAFLSPKKRTVAQLIEFLKKKYHKK